ncbi:hypothetical protein ASE00_04150 [Sphingomonas sp. Root710]|uniref:hypothetical protein n=1 Tax=Sphingomonas sp. Root710 TaxID=1736594 RepID=UPI0006F2D648|nr:hypothetical protein [Sphingomonas sp. Root710]KRB85950.1 hypothetical protein ASE00_04150 [Sphingomonas sp. Root710]
MSRNRPPAAARIGRSVSAARAAPPATIPPAFVDELIADWREHGREAIRRVRTWAPQRYVHLAAALAPAAPSGEDQIAAMSDAEVEQQLRHIITLLDRAGALPAWLRLVHPGDVNSADLHPADI